MNLTVHYIHTFFQVLLMLTSDLDGNDTRDRTSLDAVLSALVTQLNMGGIDLSTVSERTPSREVQLVVMRLLSKIHSLVLSCTLICCSLEENIKPY